jgi:ectoine hydroxylase-related dioxygenase (phytanoyl-CoA dioxygenase family)
MALNRSPARAVTQADIETYQRDGAVVLRNVCNREWIDKLLPVAARLAAGKEDFGLLPTYPGRYMARTIPEFRELAFHSPIAEAACRVMGSKEAHFFFDEIFAKAPQSAEKTIWHTDRMGWPVSGKMVPSLWMPLTRVTKANSLECILGSHTQDVRYWLFSPNARKMIKPPDRVPHPDCEPLRGNANVRFMTWDMEPGDVLVVHPWTLHYSHGNPTDGWRIAVSVRIFGDDIVWDPRPDCVNLAGISHDEMIAGERPSGALCPLVWSEDGRRDDADAIYPRGFATQWTRARKSDINEYDVFMKNFEATKRGAA